MEGTNDKNGNNKKKKYLVITTEKDTGIITRVTGLFSKRAFSITNFSADANPNETVAKIYMEVEGDSKKLEQAHKDLVKLVNIMRVEDLSDISCIESQLVLLKIHAPSRRRAEIIATTNAFGGKILDIGQNVIISEFTGSEDKVTTAESIINKTYGVFESARSAKILLPRVSKGENETDETKDITNITSLDDV